MPLYVAADGVIYPLDAGHSCEDLLNDCFRKRLNEIWSNLVSAVKYFAGLPGSFLAIVAECAWEASATYWSW